MKKLIASAAFAAALVAAPFALAAQSDNPVAPDAAHLTKSPPGSVVTIVGTNKAGNETNFYYRVQPDGSLKLIFQEAINDSDR
ncbi:hypothetical protein FJU08_17185 [Martelella alba]|uniref:Uncharacterized protein n=1 Tax=Martelella alba TaxID=2590451 RepID=A0A506U3Y3_9HYPH|nr:hypothetical protein [Martelella alba]TPW28540.1 hypothetical protein FJU08_17185 [Martelella alba]